MGNETRLKTDTSVEDDDIKKILMVLFRSNGPAPLGYISNRTAIKEPLKILRKMEGMSLVRQCPHSCWSCCMDPIFKITSEAQKQLLEQYFGPYVDCIG
jgi:hypothetical protein